MIVRKPIRRAALSRGPAGPWMYTGALENHPDLVRALSERRPLWGNDAATLRRARSPLRVARSLSGVTDRKLTAARRKTQDRRDRAASAADVTGVPAATIAIRAIASRCRAT